MASRTLLAPLFIVAIITGCSHGPGHPHAKPQQSASAATSSPTTVDIQGASEWKKSPHMRAYYEETVATFANGADIDVDAYEVRSFAIFREFARANGMNEEGMIDHLKLIPRQVVGIVREDPGVLKNYDSFWAALAGPD
ncbi:hypothetical protein HNQ60_005317 [Povalibacter uvarum]|uniref:Uncharacterized protein n=1 Tax=Povalibacter uvarum TaxID=732238 RepID=A0A841HX78_9GAMM|nr:hypothetical protein [Povalibacter uvarum]MBB6096395.1 hypothetical protein [Povalibacter uvarum]